MAIINVIYAAAAVPTAAQQTDITYAAAQWQAILNVADPNLTINVQVWAVDMTGTGLNAMCIPGFVQTVNQTLTRPQAKLLGLGGIAQNDPAIDLVVVMDTVTPWVLGTPPAVLPVGGQYSLATTIMHELCHGLGFLGLCNVYPPAQGAPGQGIYTAANTLIPLLQGTVAAMVPPVVLPANYFPAAPITGFAVITPFAHQFWYANGALVKGVAADDYTAFMGADSIFIGVMPAGQYTVLTTNGGQFQPFTTCDHITGANYLMNPSTVGQYYAVPDASSRAILRLIGWTVA